MKEKVKYSKRKKYDHKKAGEVKTNFEDYFKRIVK